MLLKKGLSNKSLYERLMKLVDLFLGILAFILAIATTVGAFMTSTYLFFVSSAIFAALTYMHLSKYLRQSKG